MPAYEAEAFVVEAVRSVLAQDHPSFELIAVNDGSTDATPVLLDDLARNEPRMRVVHQANEGAGAARNAGLALAQGDMIALMDADDRLHPGLLRRATGMLAAGPDLDIVFPRHRWIHSDGTPFGRETQHGTARYRGTDLMIDNPIDATSGVVLRRVAVERAGGYDPKMPACIDLDFFTRAVAGRGRAIGKLDAVLADYRRHEGQITADWRRLRDGWERMVAKAEAAGNGLGPRDRGRGRARAGLLWAGIAYKRGEYRAARALMARCLLDDPALVLGDSYARVRVAAALASLLPEGLHKALRDRANRDVKAR